MAALTPQEVLAIGGPLAALRLRLARQAYDKLIATNLPHTVYPGHFTVQPLADGESKSSDLDTGVVGTISGVGVTGGGMTTGAGVTKVAEHFISLLPSRVPLWWRENKKIIVEMGSPYEVAARKLHGFSEIVQVSRR